MPKIILFLLFAFIIDPARAQTGSVMSGDTNVISYANPKEYTLVDVYVSGCRNIDSNVVRLISGLPIGDKITVPGEKTSAAIDKIWKEGLFEDIWLEVAKVEGAYIWLRFVVVEKPNILVPKEGLLIVRPGGKKIKKSEREDIEEKLRLRGEVFTEYKRQQIIQIVNEHYIDDGYINCKTTVEAIPFDTGGRFVQLKITIDKGKKVRIEEILIAGNQEFKKGKIKRMMKDTKEKHWWNPFKQSKFLQDNYDTDKQKVLAKYRSKGYRDVRFAIDSVQRLSENRVRIHLNIVEGRKYKFGTITWVGNTKYSSKYLTDMLGIKPGETYNEELFDSRLYMSAQGNDISSLYMDQGYLFFQINPVEVRIHGDTIDYEMRIYEGRPATIRNVSIVGNTKTNDRVVMREIRTRPGDLFRRSDVIRSQRELASLGYFDPEKIEINPKPDPYTGTVDIEYVVVERPSDQVELSGGWGGNRLVGTLGVSFNNFSTKNFWDATSWRPLPSGDGQKLSVRAQSNGLYFQSYNASFTEPWLGGKKPNSLSFTIYRSVQSNGLKKDNPLRQDVAITGGTIGFGKRLKKPDDYFTMYMELNYQYYNLNNFYAVFAFASGYSHNLNTRFTLQRNSLDQTIYPRSGSDIKLIGQFTPPYSLFSNRNYAELTPQEKYKFVEYYKWKFTSSWFTRIAGDLVLNTRVGFGFLLSYNKDLGTAPFERFYLGGSGLTGYALDGREIIALRGYDDQSLSGATGTGQPVIAKYTWELRYPVSLNPSATVYGLAFVEAGNTWGSFKEFNPFDVYRSAGIGVRVFLPMFGLLGLDYAWRFDDVPTWTGMQRSQIHFTIGLNLGEL